MTTSPDFDAIADRILPGARLCAARRLTGGVSADIHALQLEGVDGSRRTVVVRQHRAAEWKPRDKHVAVMEYELLRVLHQAGICVPEPLLLDIEGHPYLVMEFIEGSVEVAADQLDPCLKIMAKTLTQLHAFPTRNLPSLPSRTNPLPELFDYLPDVPQWAALRAHLSEWTDSSFHGRTALLHGDFWPGNLLWRDGCLVAILDWEDAALGDSLCDVAGCRLELLWKYGITAMQRFTELYERENSLDKRRLALWEVYVGSAAAHFMGKWGLAPTRVAEMRKLTDAFVQQAGKTLLFNDGPA